MNLATYRGTSSIGGTAELKAEMGEWNLQSQKRRLNFSLLC